MPGAAHAIAPLIAPVFKAVLRFDPPAKDTAVPAKPAATAVLRPKPAIPKAPGPRAAVKATVATIRPTGEETTDLTALPTALNAPPIALPIPPRPPPPPLNSIIPVAGLMVPAPPMALSIWASWGLIWAKMVSPPRPF